MMTKYGTLEYRLEKLQEALNEATSAAKVLREEKGQIMPMVRSFNANRISIFSFSKEYEELEYPSSLENFYGNYGSTWNRFDKTNETHVTNCLKKAEDRLAVVLETAAKYHAENLPIIENNKKCRQNIFNFLKSYGLNENKYAEVKGGRNPKKDWIPCAYIKEINDQIPVSDGYDNYVSTVKSRFESMKKYAETYQKEITAKKREEEQKLRESKEAAEAILYCQNNGIVTENLSIQQIVDVAENHEREKWIAENYPNGRTISHSCCDYCSEWTIGERRCSCGNRRMNLVVEGKGQNRYAYAEAY